MSELWEDIRSAIASKADADVASIRRSTMGRPERRGGHPSVIVGLPRMGGLEMSNANTDRYTLTFPCEVRVPRPAGEQRAETAAGDLMYLLVAAWRSGIKLGQTSTVVGSAITDADPVLDEDPDLIGWQFTVTVDVYETFNPGRTA